MVTPKVGDSKGGVLDKELKLRNILNHTIFVLARSLGQRPPAEKATSSKLTDRHRHCFTTWASFAGANAGIEHEAIKLPCYNFLSPAWVAKELLF